MSSDKKSGRLIVQLSQRLCLLVIALPCAKTAHAELLGVDVSQFQSSVNWTSMKNAGVEFGFAKATEGVNFNDVWFTTNMNNARAAGVPIGPYHYGRPDSAVGTLADPIKQDAINEANDFVDAIEPFYTAYPGQYLRPVLDVEELPSTAEINTVSEQREYLSDWIRDFNDVVQDRLGVDVIIYLNSNYANNYIEPSIRSFDLWLARWTYNTNNQPTQSNLGVWNDWEFWQWSDSESIGGESPVDANLFQGNLADLQQYLVGSVEPVLAGDYNDDGVVDAADFTVWRDNWLSSGIGLPGDGDGDGFVGNTDYTLWANNFGATLPTLAVPEPSALGMLMVFVGGVLPFKR